MRRLDKLDRVEVVASQQHGVRERASITDAEAEIAAWAVVPGEPAGAGVVKVGGARAIGLALAVGRDARWPTLPWALPFRIIGLPWTLDRLYEIVARCRERLPGETPWCVEHPGECSPPPDS